VQNYNKSLCVTLWFVLPYKLSPRFCHKGTKSVLWLSKYAKIRFRPELCPGTRRGSSRRTPHALVGWGGDTPPHTPPHRHRPTLALDVRPPEFQPDLRLCKYGSLQGCVRSNVFSVDVVRMKNITAAILVLMVVACVATVAQSAAFAHSWYGRKRGDDDAGQMVSKWLPTLTSKKFFHPGPGPDEEHAVPTKRKQVR